ncbi:MAG TPA: ribulose-phosphate 3-epimerase [Gemmataceae bacterium]|jgi:ribulose-phosphate 3-epimerase|nr:ribulose-phosphate 3-epimerase [Gemmataceae bacterium]
MSAPIKLAPSVLAANFACLGDEVRKVEAAGADRIHIDVMDGRFVPNLSMGSEVVESLRAVTSLPLEAHLMVYDPDRYLDAFAGAGATTIIVHQEGNPNLHRTIQEIKRLQRKVGVAINPATPALVLEEVLPLLDLVLVMTVNPGFGGQAFLPITLSKIRRVRTLIDRVRPECELEVDGGIDTTSAPRVVESGANVLVAGSAVFHAPGGPAQGMQQLRVSVQ